MAHRLTMLSVVWMTALASGPTLAADLGLYVTDYMDAQDVRIKPLGGQVSTTATMFATPGEYESVSFAVRPLERVEDMFMESGPLTGPGGRLEKENVRVRSVEGFQGGNEDILMDLGHPWSMPAYRRELFWVTVHVPEQAQAGVYRGAVSITSKGQPIGKLDLELEVLPIRLEEPPYALGFNYSSPKDPQLLAAHLRDMREHGMTTVAPLYNFHLPIYDEDTSELGQFIEAYKAAGFTKPIYFASPMSLSTGELLGYGPVDSRRFQRKYLQVMRRLQAEVEKHDVPVIFSIGDEFTNQALPGIAFADKLARLVYEELPEICATSDMNGYLEVTTMAPHLDIATFNNGWDGIDGHNKGRRLINKDFILEIQKTGAIPWFVNAQTERFPFGIFFWKMAGYGVRGKVEWYYNLEDNARGSVVRLEGTTVYPTLAYERAREGVDDLKYLCKLEALVAEGKRAGKAQPQVAQAEALLKKIGDAILDNWTAYTEGGESFPPDGFDVMPAGKAAQLGDYNAVRRAVADQITALQQALK